MTDRAERTTIDHQVLHWRKSSFSSIGECVEVADDHHGGVAVRNSNSPDAGTVILSRTEMAALIAGCKAGEFDDLGALTRGQEHPSLTSDVPAGKRRPN